MSGSRLIEIITTSDSALRDTSLDAVCRDGDANLRRRGRPLVETFATTFVIRYRLDGEARALPITPECYQRLRGPYNRRNVYGAVLAYGPVLQRGARTRALFAAVSRHALCGDGPLLVELGLDPRRIAGSVRIRLQPRAGAVPDSLPLVLEPDCREAP